MPAAAADNIWLNFNDARTYHSSRFLSRIGDQLDLQQHNLGINSAWKRAQDRSKWRKLMETAMSCQGRATL